MVYGPLALLHLPHFLALEEKEVEGERVPGDDLPSLEGRVCKGSRRKSSVTLAFLAVRMVGHLGLGPPGAVGKLQTTLQIPRANVV